MKETCFKLHGYPNWYKQLKENKKNKSNLTHMANANYNQQIESPLHELVEISQTTNHDQFNDESINNLLQQFSQLIKANHKSDVHFPDISYFGDFLDMRISLLNSLKSDRFNRNTWILDTTATAHMCAQLSSINQSTFVTKYAIIFLHDGSIKSITHI